MKAHHRSLLAGLACMLALAGCASNRNSGHEDNDVYQLRRLVSDRPVPAAEHFDPNLVNPWGIVFNPYGVVWVSDNGRGVSTLYDGNGVLQPLVVTIPPATPGGTGRPTGIVFYGGQAFTVSNGRATGPSRFIFASEDGVISGWAPNVNATNAIRVLTTPGAIYKGLAISGGGTGNRLYAADFFNNKVDVFDSAFAPVALPATAFRDPRLPAGFAPFGIQAINGDLYVSYAKQSADREDDVAGRGFGYINVFTPNGELVRRLVSRGVLNAPWGMALAPASFGQFANRLLVGNFGDGLIHAYDLVTGHLVGHLRGTDHKAIKIDGLWGLAFGNGVANQPTSTLFFTAGPDNEQHGLYGRLDLVPDDDHVKPGDHEAAAGGKGQ